MEILKCQREGLYFEALIEVAKTNYRPELNSHSRDENSPN